MIYSSVDIIVIGAGHAGLSISYYLSRLRINHLVFEKGSIGETWRKQRWNSFRFNTPAKVNLLPGHDNTLTGSEGFWSAKEFISLLEDYSSIFNLPVLEGCEVLSVEKNRGSNLFSISVLENGSIRKYHCRLIISASGFQNRKFLPEFSKKISRKIEQIHAGDYKNPNSLPDGGVLIAGSAQSGVQIAEELINAGRQVYISTSRVGRVPRRYRGKDIVDWMIMTGFFDMKRADISDPGVIQARFPQISGVGRRGHTVSLQSLARSGAVILGRMTDAHSTGIYILPDAVNNVRFADEASENMKLMIDQYINNRGIEAALPEEDEADIADESGACASQYTTLDLKKNKISSVIWATGFKNDLSYLKFPVTDGKGNINHMEGISETEGLYFLGQPWMRKRKSGIVLGILEDAGFITRKILEKYPAMATKERMSIIGSLT